MPAGYRKYFYNFLFLFFLPAFLFAQTALVNINTASLTELKTLNGIGDVKGQAIIDYRTQNGLFQNIVDIKNVSGIGDVTYNNIKDFIIVGSNNTSTTTNSTSTTTTTTTNSQISDTTSQPVDTDVHYSSVQLSNVIPQPTYKVGAGRARLGTVGTPIEFKGESNADFTGQTVYKWSFGDGAIGYGHIVSHSYAYAGDYVVVLNATSPAGQAVSKADVKIISEDFSISNANSERIEIQNNSKYELNLFGRELVSFNQKFVFPEDTLIKSGAKISFASSITGLRPVNIYEVSLVVVGSEMIKQNEEMVKANMTAQIQELQNKVAFIPKENRPEIIPAVQNNQTASVIVGTKPLKVSTTTPIVRRSWFERLKLFFLGK